MNKQIRWLSTLVFCFLFCPVILADTPQTQHTHTDRFEQIANKLDLTTEQKSKIKTIREQTQAAVKPKFTEVRAIHQNLNDLAMAKTLDEEKVNLLVNQEKELLGQILKIRVLERYNITSLMTPEQKDRFSTMIRDWESQRKNAHRA